MACFVSCISQINCNISLILSHVKYNKQFKSDSARLAFLVWIEFSDYGGQVKCCGRVLHTLIGR
ncbi:hypothetical protein FCU94_15500 [Vibrio sp. JPW-9-11-11]|nr:hypothetical protein [Vibrio sp. JPW-9-11-11]